MSARNPLTYWKIYAFFTLGIFCCSYSFADFPADLRIADLERSIVQVTATVGRKQQSGTGFITAYDPQTQVATVFTNGHVINFATSISCCSWRNGKKVSCGRATVVRSGYTSNKDFAVLKVKVPESLGPKVLKCSKSPPAFSSRVYGCGFPGGRGLVIYCATVRSKVGSTIIGFDTQISGGTSGGPLFNEKGEVCGVCTLVYQSGSRNSGAFPIADWL